MSSDSDSVVSGEDFESASEGDLTRSLPPAALDPLVETPRNNTDNILRTSPATNERPQSVRKRSIPRTSEDREQQRPRSAFRAPSSSSSAGEDPISNAGALRGEIPTLELRYFTVNKSSVARSYFWFVFSTFKSIRQSVFIYYIFYVSRSQPPGIAACSQAVWRFRSLNSFSENIFNSAIDLIFSDKTRNFHDSSDLYIVYPIRQR
jgi:hypothetical protein